MDMYCAYVLQKNIDKEKGTIYEKEIFKMNCGFCGQQSYFCVCSKNRVQKI